MFFSTIFGKAKKSESKESKLFNIRAISPADQALLQELTNKHVERFFSDLKLEREILEERNADLKDLYTCLLYTNILINCAGNFFRLLQAKKAKEIREFMFERIVNFEEED